MVSNCSKSRSIQVSIGRQCPTGGTPPILKPVDSRTKSGVAFSICSPINSDIWCSFTRFAPLAITSTGLPDSAALKMMDFAIWATEHPITFAASFAVLVVVGISVTSASTPTLRRYSRTLCGPRFDWQSVMPFSTPQKLWWSSAESKDIPRPVNAGLFIGGSTPLELATAWTHKENVLRDLVLWAGNADRLMCQNRGPINSHGFIPRRQSLLLRRT